MSSLTLLLLLFSMMVTTVSSQKEKSSDGTIIPYLQTIQNGLQTLSLDSTTTELTHIKGAVMNTTFEILNDINNSSLLNIIQLFLSPNGTSDDYEANSNDSHEDTILTKAKYDLNSPKKGSEFDEIFPQNSTSHVKLDIMTAVQSKDPDKNEKYKLESLKSMNISQLILSPPKIFSKLNVSSVCIQHIWTAMTSSTRWSMEMLDAMGRPGPGVLNGNIYWLGEYDQCLNIKVVDEKLGLSPFSTQFCTISVPISFDAAEAFGLLGVCVPDTCTETDILSLGNAVLASIQGNDAPLLATSTNCNIVSRTLDAKAIFSLFVIGVFLTLMIVGTALDVVPKLNTSTLKEEFHNIQNEKREFTPLEIAEVEEDNTVTTCESQAYIPKDQKNEFFISTSRRFGFLLKLCMSFSVWTNCKKLLNTEQSGFLGSVHGIRFISMTWIVLGHAYTYAVPFAQNLPSELTRIKSTLSYMPIANALIAVDTFFSLSGLLVSYIFLKEMDKRKGKMNWAKFYFHRYWRLTPPYMMVLLLHATLFRYIGDGPLWREDGADTMYCNETWWTNLLYINNFNTFEKRCMGWTWYLADDMQFYIMSPLILVPLFFWKKAGMFICGILLTIVTVTPAILTMNYNLPLSPLSSSLDMQKKYYLIYYVTPYCRMGPYIVGIITGFMLHQKRHKEVKISKTLCIFLWTVAATLACLSLYGVYRPLNDMHTDQIEKALYNSTSRTLWGMCICWVIFSCEKGYGGYVNTLLSWKAFIPLGRLTYCVYLINPILVYLYMMTSRQPFYGSDPNLVYLFFGLFVTSYMVAFVISLAFEAPMMMIEKNFFRFERKIRK